MKSKNKQVIVVGDRVLIRPDEGEKKSAAGLYLPASVLESHWEIPMKISRNPGGKGKRN